jgi:hypothetical protein
VWPFDLLNISNRSARRGARRGARREERYQTNLLSTELGEVVDISGSGMRIRAKWRMKLVVGATFRANIRSPQGTISTRCRVVRFARVREPGFRGVDISVTIVDAEPGLRAALVHLGKFGFIPRSRLGSPGGPAGELGTEGKVDQFRRDRQASPDYYKILGVASGATSQEIRRAYHGRARPVHPDAVGSAAGAVEFELLGEAYRVLRDAQRRFAYDQLRNAYGSAA